MTIRASSLPPVGATGEEDHVVPGPGDVQNLVEANGRVRCDGPCHAAMVFPLCDADGSTVMAALVECNASLGEEVGWPDSCPAWGSPGLLPTLTETTSIAVKRTVAQIARTAIGWM